MSNPMMTSPKPKNADCWFLLQIKDIVDFEGELAALPN